MNITILQPDDFKNWTAIPNRLILDELLKSDEVRLYCYLKSRPTDWQYNAKHVQKLFGWGRSKTYEVLNKLKSAGWIEIQQGKSQDGKFGSNVACHLHTEPINTTSSPCVDFTVYGKSPCAANAVYGKSGHINNNDYTNKTELINKTLSSESERNLKKISFSNFRKLLAESGETFVFENGICSYLPTAKFKVTSTGYIHNITAGKDVGVEDAQKIWAYLYENRVKVLSNLLSLPP